MKLIVIAFLFMISFSACKSDDKPEQQTDNKRLSALFEQYQEETLKLYPLNATGIGDIRYNDLLSIDFTDSYRKKTREFYARYRDSINEYDRDNLGAQDQLSYDVFIRDMDISLESFEFSDNYVPFTQFYSLPLSMGQLGSGDGNQPFKTVKDYEDWIKRATAFSAWTDSSIVYFKKGIATGFVLPASLVVKMIPQMVAMQSEDAAKSIFYGPVKKMPATFSDADKKRLTEEYVTLIKEQLNPSYKKLAVFLEQEYLPKARTTSGISAVPNGSKYYQYLIKRETTTNKTPEEIYKTGLAEVARIKGLMDSIKNVTGFKGDLPAFFEYMKTDKKFMPYKTPADVLAGFEKIHQTMLPFLSKAFTTTPKTAFEIRQTEAYRAASASAEYSQGSPDGKRPGIFYVPILDAKTFNVTSGMESLFLHEAIPGHHYQISLQQEDTLLPKFRRFGGNGAYVEGWALYCESLGKELGLYTDPYQLMGALGDEMHRAIRLVVDVAIHTKNMTREEAIKYMMDNEAISEQGAIAEIERYMVIPAQALSYKIGALKIKELRTRYEKQLGASFSLSEFHTQILKDGSLPLDVLEREMDKWAASKNK